MRLRCQLPGGAQETVELGEGATVRELLERVSGACGFAAERLEALGGFPRPSPLVGETLAEAGVRSGERVIVKLRAAPEEIVRRKMPDDNACLFWAIAYVMRGAGGRREGAAAAERAAAVAEVEGDPAVFSDAVLGRPRAEYAALMREKARWGGEIEMLALSRHHRVEIVAASVQTQRFNTYGEGCGYGRRVYLVYTGVHYDALARAASADAPEAADTTLFDAPDEATEAGVRRLVARLHADRAFVDQANFTLRCDVCGEGVVGRGGAQAHASQTGHTAFSEFS